MGREFSGLVHLLCTWGAWVACLVLYGPLDGSIQWPEDAWQY